MNIIVKKVTLLMAMTLMVGQLYAASAGTTGDTDIYPEGSGVPVSRLFAPDPVVSLGSCDQDSAGPRSLGQQVLDIMRGTFIARQEYMRSMDDHRAALLESLPTHITPEMLDRQGCLWRNFIIQRDKDWELFEGYVQEVMDENYDPEKLGELLNKTHWVQFAMHKNRMILEHGCPYLIEKAPDIIRIYENDADIFRYALSLFLPLMSGYPGYQEHFQDCKIDALRTEGKVAPAPKVVSDKSRVQVTTSVGARLEFPLPPLNGGRMNIYADDLTDKHQLVFRMKSGFAIGCMGIDRGEAEYLLSATQFAFKEDDDARYHARKKAEREERAKADAAVAAERARLAVVQAAAKKASEAEAKAKADAAADALLEEMGAAPLGGIAKKGGKKKGASKSGSGSDAPSISAAVIAVGSSVYEPLTEEGLVVSGSASAAAIEATMPASAEGAGDSFLSTVDGEARPSRPINPSEGKRPAHHTVIPVVGPFGKSDRQQAAPREVLDPRANNTLSVFLGSEVEGAVRAIHTVDWGDTVHLLKKLGFAYDNGDIFTDAKKRRLILDKLHYDENCMNHKAKRILLRQLQGYGFTEDVLKGYLGE